MNENTKIIPKRLSIITSLILLFLFFVATPVFAWLNSEKVIAGYAPVSTISSLFIGAGHNEDIKYLYFDGIDAAEGDPEEPRYKYYVFCISGEFASYYKIQLAYTTNNQFSYDIFHATESSNPSGATVSYTTVGGDTYYYAIDGSAIAGHFLNSQTVDGEVACSRLPYGKGVCWKSVLDEKIVNIKNVHEFSGHIACDARSNSELVVPIKKNGSVYLVVDIDSPLLNRFSYDDEINIGNICKILEEKIN